MDRNTLCVLTVAGQELWAWKMIRSFTMLLAAALPWKQFQGKKEFLVR